VMAMLVAFGFWHARRTPESAEILAKHTVPTPVEPAAV
jgi:hypothetical protein